MFNFAVITVSVDGLAPTVLGHLLAQWWPGSVIYINIHAGLAPEYLISQYPLSPYYTDDHSFVQPRH